MTRILRIMMLAFICLAGPSAVFASTPSWAAVRPEAKTYTFPEADKAHLRLPIRDIQGQPLYMLECYAFAVAPRTIDFVYSGDFECRLHSYKGIDRYTTLLTELSDATRDWESRGRFLAAQVASPCGRYKELGRVRSFALRGFRLVLRMDEVSFENNRQGLWGDSPALKSFKFRVEITSDPTARSEVAAPAVLPPLERVAAPCRAPFGSLYLAQFRKQHPKKVPRDVPIAR